SGGRSSADGVQTSAQTALQSARRLSNWFSSIFGHSAPNVDRPNRVQLVEEGGCRVTSNNEIKGSRSTAEKDVPAGTMAVVRSPDFLPALKETALATLIHRRRLTPSRGGQAPTAETRWERVQPHCHANGILIQFRTTPRPDQIALIGREVPGIF